MRQLIERYLQALSRGDYPAIIGLFTENAKVESPLYGDTPAREFYNKLLGDTHSSVIVPLHIFVDETGGVAHFRYEWTLADGTRTSFQCADVFEFEAGKITRLTIIYDTHHTRAAFEKLSSSARQSSSST